MCSIPQTLYRTLIDSFKEPCTNPYSNPFKSRTPKAHTETTNPKPDQVTAARALGGLAIPNSNLGIERVTFVV